MPTMALPMADARTASPEGEVETAVLGAQRGEAAALAALYRLFAKSVHGVLLSRLAPEDAQELTQEVFIAVQRRIGDLREPGRFGPWVHSIARNLSISALREEERRRRHEMRAESREERGADGELRLRVLHHLQGLPEAYRETLTMRLVDGMSGPEIAAATGMSHASVRVNLMRGMELLRPLLKNEGWS
jgi:RNA polymerase sigma-70 factor, ECF subfamily